MRGSEAGELWAHYRRALLRIDVAGRTLAVRLVPQRLAGTCGPWPFDRPVVVLTACNPGSVPRRARANAVAQARLERELRAAGHVLLAAEGVGEDSGWVERSVAVPGLDLREAVALGVRHGQRALYRLDASGAQVVGCLDAGRSERWPWESRWGEPLGRAVGESRWGEPLGAVSREGDDCAGGSGSAGTGRTGGTPGPGGHRQT